jgi:hypothetical protein
MIIIGRNIKFNWTLGRGHTKKTGNVAAVSSTCAAQLLLLSGSWGCMLENCESSHGGFHFEICAFATQNKRIWCRYMHHLTIPEPFSFWYFCDILLSITGQTSYSWLHSHRLYEVLMSLCSFPLCSWTHFRGICYCPCYGGRWNAFLESLVYCDRLCGLVVRVPGYSPSDPGATRFS